MSTVNTTELRQFVERIENLEAQKAEIAEDIAAVKQEAKDRGFDPKGLNFVLSMRKKEKHDLNVMKLYAEAVGVFS